MPEYGQQARTATQDANEGVVNPPSLRTSQRTSTAKQSVKSTLSEGVASLGASLGGALQDFQDRSKAEERKQKMLEARIRQGQDTAINQIDKDKKRTDWEKYVYGQSIEYRAAQQRAVENSVQQAYLEASTEVDSYAHLKPEDYSKRTTDALNKMLEVHKGDTETQNIVTEAWAKSAQKLSQQHYKAHYAHSQTQHRETTRLKIRGSIDELANDYRASTDNDERDAVISEALKIFDVDTARPYGMDKLAYRGLLNEELAHSLINGNIGIYKVATQKGWIQNLTAGEKVRMDAALDKYDKIFSDRVERVFSEGYNAMLDIQSASSEEAAGLVQAHLDTLLTKVQELKQNSSGTDKARNKLADTEVRIKEIKERGIKATAKNLVEAQEFDAIKEALASSDPVKRSALPNEPEKIKEAGDSVIYDMINRAVGQELETEDAIRFLMTDPKGRPVMKDVVRLAKTWKHKSPLMEKMIGSVVSGWENMYDESGILDKKRAAEYMARIDIIGSDDELVNKLGRAEGAGLYRLIRNGMGMNQTKEQLDQRIQNYKEWYGKSQIVGDKGIPNIEVDDVRLDKQDFVIEAVAEATGMYPEGLSLARYMVDYQDGLIENGYRHDAAIQHVINIAKNNNAYFNNTLIPHANELKEVLGEYQLDDIMKWADKGDATRPEDPRPVDYITQQLGIKGRSLYKIENLKAEIVAGSNHVVFSYQGGAAPVPVPFSWFKLQKKGMIKAHQDEKERQENNQKNFIKQALNRSSESILRNVGIQY